MLLDDVCPIVGIIQLVESPVYAGCLLAFLIMYPVESHVYGFSLFALYLTIYDGVCHCVVSLYWRGGCLCPNSSSMILMYTALRAIMYSPESSASVADDITFLMMCAMFSTAPLFGGMAVSFDRKKCPPALLGALGAQVACLAVYC